MRSQNPDSPETPVLTGRLDPLLLAVTVFRSQHTELDPHYKMIVVNLKVSKALKPEKFCTLRCKFHI